MTSKMSSPRSASACRDRSPKAAAFLPGEILDDVRPFEPAGGGTAHRAGVPAAHRAGRRRREIPTCSHEMDDQRA